MYNIIFQLKIVVRYHILPKIDMFLIKLTIYKINYIDTISGCIIINTIKSLFFFGTVDVYQSVQVYFKLNMMIKFKFKNKIQMLKF